MTWWEKATGWSDGGEGMNQTGIGSMIRIFQKNAEMQLPQKAVYRVLASLAVFCIMVPCMLVVGFISEVMTEALVEAGSPSGGILFEMQILSAFSMIFGLMVIFSVMFFSSDREHLVTLPIPAHHLMIAKFLYAFLAESVMEFLVLIAVFVGYGIGIGRSVGVADALHPVTLVAEVLGTFLIPMVPMVYCAVFSLILMAALGGVRSEKLFYHISTVFLLLFAGLFLYSLRGIGEINVENYVVSLGSGDNLLLKTLNVVFFPVVWLSEAVSGADIGMLLLYLAANACLLAALYGLGKLLYQKGLYTAAKLGTTKRAGIRKKDVRQDTPFMASLNRELYVILRTRAFSGNTAYINALWPVGALLLFYFAGDKGTIAELIKSYQRGQDRAEMLMVMLMVSIAFIASALNSLASTAFTREGQHLSLIKFIPVSYRTQMYAKAAVCVLFTYPMLLATEAVICSFVGVPLGKAILYAVFMLLAHIISIVVGMGMDSAAPYVTWSDEYSALRGNLNVFFNMAVMMMISLGVCVLGFLLYEVLGMPIEVYHIVLLLVMLGVCGRMCVTGSRKILKNMEEMEA